MFSLAPFFEQYRSDDVGSQTYDCDDKHKRSGDRVGWENLPIASLIRKKLMTISVLALMIAARTSVRLRPKVYFSVRGLLLSRRAMQLK